MPTLSTNREQTTLLAPAELQSLERLRFSPRRRFAGRMRGERISRQKGVSVEFADFRDYAAGDDLRHLDWSILARHDRPTIRTYQDEDDLAVYVALDASASMDFGDPSKFSAAQRLAAALGFIGLCGQDAVYPIALADTPARSQVLRGRGSYNALLRWAGAARPAGTRGFADCLRQLARAGQFRAGLFVCITDALDPEAPASIRAIGSRGHELLLVQVLSLVDLDPEVEGDLRLLDSETGLTVDITAHAEALQQYRRNLAAHCRAVEEAVTRAGGRYIRVTSGDSPLETITRDLRRIGVVE